MAYILINDPHAFDVGEMKRRREETGAGLIEIRKSMLKENVVVSLAVLKACTDSAHGDPHVLQQVLSDLIQLAMNEALP